MMSLRGPWIVMQSIKIQPEAISNYEGVASSLRSSQRHA
jgi:hypothetical protein